MAAAESAASSYPGEDAPMGEIVGVRPRLQDVRQGGPFTATLDDEITVDFRAGAIFQNLIDREILPDPRSAKDLLSAMPKNKRKKRLKSCPNRIGPQYCRRSPSGASGAFKMQWMDGCNR